MLETIFNHLIARPALDYVSRGKLSILIYHRVNPEFDPLYMEEVTATTFDWQMKLVSQCFNVLPLVEAIQLLRKDRLPSRSLCVTFDDGYADNAEVALPILKKHDLTATFFVSTGFLNGGRMWNDTVIESIRYMTPGLLNLTEFGLGTFNLKTWTDRKKCFQAVIEKIRHLPQNERQAFANRLEDLSPEPLPDHLMMTSEQVKELHDAGMTIGGHTVTHPILSTLELSQVETEIREGRSTLEKIINEPVRVFAYPNGKPGADYLPEQVSVIKELGLEGAVSTAWGVSSIETDPYQLKRFTPWDKNSYRFALRLIKNYLS